MKCVDGGWGDLGEAKASVKPTRSLQSKVYVEGFHVALSSGIKRLT